MVWGIWVTKCSSGCTAWRGGERTILYSQARRTIFPRGNIDIKIPAFLQIRICVPVEATHRHDLDSGIRSSQRLRRKISMLKMDQRREKHTRRYSRYGSYSSKIINFFNFDGGSVSNARERAPGPRTTIRKVIPPGTRD